MKGMAQHGPAFLRIPQPVTKCVLLLCCALALMTSCERQQASPTSAQPSPAQPVPGGGAKQVSESATEPKDTTKTKPYDVKRCTPKLLSSHATKGKVHIHIRKSDKPTGRIPVVACQILESGEVVNVALKQSSGIRDKDNLALRWVKQMKYNERPGCGVVETNMGVTIDFF